MSLLVGMFLTYLFLKIGNKYRLFDIAPEDDALKIHKKPISYLGGSAMLLTSSVVLLSVAFLKNYLAKEIIYIILAGLPIFALGFWDDLRWKNIPQPKPYRKFICLIIIPIISVLILSLAGIRINFFGFLLLDYLVTFFYIFVLVNSVNYEDGIDGLAGGLVTLSFVTFIFLSLFFKNELGLFLSLSLSGSVMSFLVFNMPKAKIFMGDSGAFFLGYILSVFAMLFSKVYDIISLIGVLFILGFLVFEAVFTNIRRIINKKSIFLGDREHLYDILYLRKRFSIKKTLFICYLLQVIFIIIGLIVLFYENTPFKT